MAIKLFNKATGAFIANISETQLAFLTGELVEESPEDVDYYLNWATVDMLEADGADPELVTLLRQALDERGELEIYWEEEG